ncbi:MAG: hypothetical protein ABI589_14040 [Burkholderiales bacterium]
MRLKVGLSTLPPTRSQDLSVRPVFRIAGAAVALFVAAVFILQSLQHFAQPTMNIEPCTQFKRRWICELGNWLTLRMPERARGPVAGMADVVVAIAMIVVASVPVTPITAHSGASNCGL